MAKRKFGGLSCPYFHFFSKILRFLFKLWEQIVSETYTEPGVFNQVLGNLLNNAEQVNTAEALCTECILSNGILLGEEYFTCLKCRFQSLHLLHVGLVEHLYHVFAWNVLRSSTIC